MSCEEIGSRIKSLREKAGLTQADLAKEMHVSREAVNQWERGARDLKSGTIIALADFFSVSCDYLLRGIETRNITLSSELGLCNKSIETLRSLSEHREEPHAQYSLDAIDFILSNDYTILREIYDYLVSDFSVAYKLVQTKHEESTFLFECVEKNVESRNMIFAQCRTDNSEKRLSFLWSDENVFEHAYLLKIQKALQECRKHLILNEVIAPRKE